MSYTSAEQCWADFESARSGVLDKAERYAALTIPKLCLPGGIDLNATEQSQDYQSLGAQGVNHLTNKVMLALFRPSQPFFRLDPGGATKKELAQIGLDVSDMSKALGELEREASRTLDRRAQRPKLYSAVRHLIVTGNVLLVFEKEELRVMGLRYFCVKRNIRGKVHTLIIKERLKFDELEDKVKEALPDRHTDKDEVDYYKWITFANGRANMTQWVNSTKLPQNFDGSWTIANCPYHVLTWDLADEADYGTGLCEDYSGALEATSTLAEAVVDGAVLGTEYRWMVDPTGVTTAEDLNNSENGDALPGRGTDITPTQGGNPQAVSTADAVLQRYERQLSQGFLMQSGMTRDAERVTAEEIRQLAAELETAYGGVYSSLANVLQLPVAQWLLDAVDSRIRSSDINISVVTGLDALSRGGDLEALRMALGDLAQITALPEELQGRIKFDKIADYVGNGRGIDLSPFLKNDAEFAAWQSQQASMRVAEQNAAAAGTAAANATAQGAMKQ